jgi:diguanylate cyclase (GGDEF)-like protein
MRRLLPALALALCLAAAPLRAQQIPLRYFTQQDGLSNVALNALVQDRNGYLWIGTENGIFRYNGAQFKRYGRDAGLGDPYVSGLQLDGDGRLWAGTRDGLYQRVGERMVPVLLDGRRLPVASGHNLASLGRDTVLAVSGKRLFRVRQEHGAAAITPYFTARQLERHTQLTAIESVWADGGGAIWAGCGKALCAVDAGEVREWGAAAGVPADTWQRIVRGADGTLWARGAHRIIALAPGAARFADRTPPGNILAKGGLAGTLTFDPDGNLVSGTDQGLARWRRGQWDLVGEPNGLLVGGGINAALVDRDQGMWLAARGHGLIRWLGYGNWENWTRAQGLPDDVVLSFAHDAKGRMTIGTRSGLATLDAGAKRLARVAGHTTLQWSTLGHDRSGTLWGATYTGELLRQRPGGAPRLHQAGLPPVMRLLFDRDGQLWLATIGGVWLVPRPEQGSPVRQPEGAPDALHKAEVRQVCQGDDGGLWFLSRQVLWRLHQGRWDSYRLSDEDGHSFKAMACDAGGVLWLASGSTGLWRAKLGPQGLRKSPVPSPMLRDKNVFSLLLDHRGWLWMGSDAGIVVWNGTQWRQLHSHDGLVWDDLNEHAIQEAPDGTVWIATSNGMSHITRPERLFAPHIVAPLIEEVSRDGKALPVAPAVVLPWSSAALQFKLASLNFQYRADLRYGYRLAGLEQDWSSTAAPDIRYPALAPGHYHLQYMTENLATGARSPVAELALVIEPPWWQSGSFRLACVLLALAVLVLAHRWRLRRLTARNAQMEALVRARTEELELRTHELELSREALRLRAMQDGLTKAWNRMAMLELMEQERSKAMRDGSAFLLVLLDLDHFKQINDSHGHPAGDRVLLEVVARLNAGVRGYDKVGRYGGEEFVLLLPELGLDAGLARVEALRAAIAAAPVALADGRCITVTASFGLAAFDPQQPASIADLLERADAALYRAKKQGRNRVGLA